MIWNYFHYFKEQKNHLHPAVDSKVSLFVSDPLPKIAHRTQAEKMPFVLLNTHFVFDVSEAQSYLMSLSRSGSRIKQGKRCSYYFVCHWRKIGLAEVTWSGSLGQVLTKPDWGNYHGPLEMGPVILGFGT